MKSFGLTNALLTVTGLFILSASQADAEGFMHVSLGAAFTEDADLDFVGFFVIPDVEFEDSVSFNIGGGYWFSPVDFLDLGVQGGMGYYRPTVELGGGIDDLEFNLIPISVLGMARIPLFKSDKRPHGLIQPYTGIGPNFLLSVLIFDDAGADIAAVGFDVGFDFRAGVNLNVTRTFGLFVEYKHTEVDATLTDSSDDLEIDFVTDHFMVGFGVHF